MKIDVQRLQKELGITAEYFDSIDSTMRYANDQILQKKRPPDAVVANFQTNGVGRVGRSFFSPESTGLYLTLILDESVFPFGDVTPRIALAVSDAIQNVFDLSCGIKWVNDLYLGSRKVSGILCRKVGAYYSIGIGVNVEKPESIPKDLEDRFGYLTESCDPDKYTELLCEIYKSCIHWSCVDKGHTLSCYRNRCNHIGKKIQLYRNDRNLFGICTGIDDDFSIVTDVDGEVMKFSSGEMSIII